ncbi:MAG: 2Fe-2S iron-sulfur cluster-binding protein [Bacteriovoracia bacterium]
MSWKVEFDNSENEPVMLNDGDNLSEKLTIQNSPILFGCRIGICGTCAIEVLHSDSELPPRTHDEIEFLGAMAPGRDEVRLACQIRINTNMKIRKTTV